ncbi:hypothetical protein ACFORL_09690 [Legionella dresdenensis]|uniref:Uncharacterized protein n=1 Tax=Legionella dresdenensis TaxID=450200 RepID=A0ABV8CGR7_9GAMM
MIKKALDYDTLKENNFRVIENNQLLVGAFKPINLNYTKSLAQHDVATSVIFGLTMHQPQVPEIRLVMKNNQIVGTFRIDERRELANTVANTIQAA